MATLGKASKSCHVPRCPQLNCQRHTREAKRRELDQHRGSAWSRGYDSRWAKFRDAYLRKNPTCAHCERRGRITPATVVDHVKPHRGDKVLLHDRSNVQPLCDRRGEGCHEAKTLRENGLAPCVTHGLVIAHVQGARVCVDCGQVAA